MEAIFNSATPLFAAVVAWAWLADRMTPARVLGLFIGFAGVVWIVWDKAGFKAGGSTGAALACLAATLCYGVAPSFTKRHLSGVAPLAVATGSQLAAAIFLALPAMLFWPAQAPAPQAWLTVAALAFFCTSLAYILYFRLIAHAGPANAVAVTYLVPIFAVAWGGILLGETLSWPVVAGCAIVFVGTALATGVVRPRLGVRPAWPA